MYQQPRKVKAYRNQRILVLIIGILLFLCGIYIANIAFIPGLVVGAIGGWLSGTSVTKLWLKS